MFIDENFPEPEESEQARIILENVLETWLKSGRQPAVLLNEMVHLLNDIRTEVAKPLN